MNPHAQSAGASAEHSVAHAYMRNGFDVVAKRFRRRGGEIDLIAKHADKYYFVEVKKARDHDTAATRISGAQIKRIQNTALRFLQEQGLGLDVDMRFDAALVDHLGRIKVIPNAFA